MIGRLRFGLSRLRERLWTRPALYALAAVALLALAVLADRAAPVTALPDIAGRTIEALLQVIAASMLGVATFAVGAMVQAYAQASQSATPRAFRLLVADDNSQLALSAFVGAYIFAILAFVVAQADLLERNGRFVLFCEILGMFALVVLTFMRWVDSIARLGRMGDTIGKVRRATVVALRRWGADRRMGARGTDVEDGRAVRATTAGHVLHVDLAALQSWAEGCDGRVAVRAVPGDFVAPDMTLAEIMLADAEVAGDGEAAERAVRAAFVIGAERTFESDPGFGLTTLSEISVRALSPGVNDPGTAIATLKALVAVFSDWCAQPEAENGPAAACDRVHMPALEPAELLWLAFGGSERAGADDVDVALWVQRAYRMIGGMGDAALAVAAAERAGLAAARTRAALQSPEDLARFRAGQAPGAGTPDAGTGDAAG